MIRWSRWNGQPGSTQRVSASPSGRTSVLRSGHGQMVGNTHGAVPSGRSASTGPTTSGITSPALRTMTVSPGRTSFAATWSWLWSVAMPTVEPPTNTGSSTANGVVRPVRPTDTWMSRRTVVRSSGGNLYAIAQRGARDVKPSSSRWARSSTLMTTPSISYGEVVAVLLPVRAVRRDRLDAVEHAHLGVDREADGAEELERLVVRAERRPADHLAELVRPERQPPLGGHRRILLAQAAGRRVARVDEWALAGRDVRLVERLEHRRRHVHLAPHLEHLGCARGRATSGRRRW